RKSADGGANWSVNDSFQIPTMSNEPCGMGTDLAGAVYAAGQITDSSGIDHAVIRSNLGGTWQTVDDFQLAAGMQAENYGFARDPSGNVYVAGCAIDAGGAPHAIIRSPCTAAPRPAAKTVFSTLAISSGTRHPWFDR